MRDDSPAGGHRGVGKEEPDQAEADEPADKLGGNEEHGRRRCDAGEGVGEDPANRHRRFAKDVELVNQYAAPI